MANLNLGEDGSKLKLSKMSDESKLKKLLEMVNQSREYFQANYSRFWEFKKFVFNTAISPEEGVTLQATLKPELEFNIMEAYISRLKGEFYKQEPSINVFQEYSNSLDSGLVDIIEGHIRHIICESNKDGMEYNIYNDTLSGGFSAIEVSVDYAHPMSFDPIIKVSCAYDPTLDGWDPLARLPHKGDGRYCFKLYPKSKREFMEEYPEIDVSNLDFSPEIKQFCWSYKNSNEEILLICEFFQKESSRQEILKLVDGQVMTRRQYNKFLKEWEASGRIEQPPAQSGKSRITNIEKIYRYKFIKNKLISSEETIFSQLPIIFVDGNSVYLKESEYSAVYQMTRPYGWNAKGVQQLKNFAGQCLANELENMIQSKIMIAKEAITDGQTDQLSNFQVPNVLIFNAFQENNPNIPLPPPQVVPRTSAPPEILQAFSTSDQTMQSILGSYDAALGINNNQLSGVAIVEGATQSNASAMPYIVGFMNAWNQIGMTLLDLIPKLYKTPRTIPVRTTDGKTNFRFINGESGANINYSSNDLKIKVEAGVSYAIQKNRALQQIQLLMNASPLMGEFFTTEALSVLLDNIEIVGIDRIKEMAEIFMQKMKQQKQQNQNQNPQMIEIQFMQQKFQQEMQLAQSKLQSEIQIAQGKLKLELQKTLENIKIDQAKLALDQEHMDNERLGVLAKITESKANVEASERRANAEEFRASADVAIKRSEEKIKEMNST